MALAGKVYFYSLELIGTRVTIRTKEEKGRCIMVTGNMLKLIEIIVKNIPNSTHNQFPSQKH